MESRKSKIQTFEDLEIWKESRLIVKDIAIIFNAKDFRDFSFRDQIMRAVISINNNIAEGFERQTKQEFIQFLFISRGSCGEVRSMLYLAKDLNYISQEQFELLLENCKILSRKIFRLIDYLKKKGL